MVASFHSRLTASQDALPQAKPAQSASVHVRYTISLTPYECGEKGEIQ